MKQKLFIITSCCISWRRRFFQSDGLDFIFSTFVIIMICYIKISFKYLWTCIAYVVSFSSESRCITLLNHGNSEWGILRFCKFVIILQGRWNRVRRMLNCAPTFYDFHKLSVEKEILKIGQYLTELEVNVFCTPTFKQLPPPLTYVL